MYKNTTYLHYFFLNGPIPASFSVYFRLFNTLQFKLKKCRWCAWESNPGRQDGRRERIHWAMAAPPYLHYYGLSIANLYDSTIKKVTLMTPLSIPSSRIDPSLLTSRSQITENSAFLFCLILQNTFQDVFNLHQMWARHFRCYVTSKFFYLMGHRRPLFRFIFVF